METTRLIPANNSFHGNKSASRTFHDKSKLASTPLFPPFYEMIRRTDGSVTLRQFQTRQEYESVRDEVFKRIAGLHELSGRKHSGCECNYCR